MKQKSLSFPILGESEVSEYGKSMGKDRHSKVMSFSNILDEAEIDTIPKTWVKWTSIVREK